MKKVLLFSLILLSTSIVSAEESKAFEPVKLQVNGLDFDLKKQEEYKINKDVFEFKKWQVEPFEILRKDSTEENSTETNSEH